MGFEDDTKLIRVPIETYETIRQLADRERRTIGQQTAVLVDRALGIQPAPGEFAQGRP